MEIRAWDDTDLDWWIGLRRQWQPRTGEGQLRALASGRVARFIHRAVARVDGERLGFSMIAIPPGDQIALAQVLVAPSRRGQGVGSRLWTDLLAPDAGMELVTWMGDDDPTSREVAEHWGFR